MKIRGERECTSCGTRWSYYETGSVGCPACGELRSVATDDPAEHTDALAAFDLTAVRDAIDEAPLQDVADAAIAPCREYVNRRGFVRGGELLDLDDTYLAASELKHVAHACSRAITLEDREELYLLSLLGGADGGERPAVDEVPTSLAPSRGLAYVDAVDAYRRDLRTWLDAVEYGLVPAQRSPIEALDDHVTRIRLLDGDVSPEQSERLVAATRELSSGLRDYDEEALESANTRLARLV